MCGICGIARSPRRPQLLERAALERMRDVLTHRGPDGAGLYVDECVGLGHRRLSIVDIEGGTQPMASGDGRAVLVYNGEIFNHPQLHQEFIAQGARYRTRCDTETVLHAWERLGRRAATVLRGMFAFALWDRERHELLLVRDRLGIKPLYYALLEDGTLVFGSEIKAILASGLVPPTLNMSALPDYLANHAPSGEETLFRGIRRLPPGHTLLWKDGRVDLERYWDLHYAPTDGRTDESWVDEYRERFRESVRLRLMADVPLGMFLSGGIDSAAITAMMSSLVREPIKTFSVAFQEREANELQYARLVAGRYATDHHEVVLTPGEFLGALPRLLWHEDEPIAHPSSVALNFVSELAARYVKVVLTGEGSDETLAGYNRYRVTLYNMRWGARYERAVPAALRTVLRAAVDRLSPRSRARRILARTFVCLPAELDAIYFDNFAVFGRARQATLLAPGVRAELATLDPYQAAHGALARCDATSLLDRLLYADTATYLHELLMKQDQMSMAASIESRVPFLDHPLVEFTATMPQRMKLRGTTTKWVLRQAMRGLLPEPILRRRKMGFPVPFGAWVRGRHRSALEDLVCGPRAAGRGLFDMAVVRNIVARHLSGMEKHDERLWSLVNLEIWQRIFLDGEAPADLRVV